MGLVEIASRKELGGLNNTVQLCNRPRSWKNIKHCPPSPYSIMTPRLASNRVASTLVPIRRGAMTVEELDNFLGTRGLQLAYVRFRDGYRWLVSQAGDGTHVCGGNSPDRQAMIRHILATPLPESGILIGQLPFDFGPFFSPFV
jgi:hypothetical protein